MDQLISISNLNDIPSVYRHTPISQLLAYHNLNQPFGHYQKAQLLIGMCMDHRKHLHIPENFAYIIRTGGANLRYSEFKVSYAIAIGKVTHLALIGHNHCGMVNLHERKEAFIQGLITHAGWEPQEAREHFTHHAPLFEIGHEVNFILSETQRLRQRYPKVTIAPMMYLVEDNQLYLIRENNPKE